MRTPHRGVNEIILVKESPLLAIRDLSFKAMFINSFYRFYGLSFKGLLQLH
jgi:hypothetical protein